jgi:hypothetical protein
MWLEVILPKIPVRTDPIREVGILPIPCSRVGLANHLDPLTLIGADLLFDLDNSADWRFGRCDLVPRRVVIPHESAYSWPIYDFS